MCLDLELVNRMEAFDVDTVNDAQMEIGDNGIDDPPMEVNGNGTDGPSDVDSVKSSEITIDLKVSRKFTTSEVKELKRRAKENSFSLFAVEEVSTLKERCLQEGINVDPAMWEMLREDNSAIKYGNSKKKKRKSNTWEVEAILDAKNLASAKPLYLIKWKDWEEVYNSWEPLEHLTGASLLLREFHLARKAAKNSSLSYETFIKFRSTIENLISPSFGDEAVILKITQTPLTHYRYTKSHFKNLKDKIRDLCSPLLNCFENGITAKNYAALIECLIEKLGINREFGDFTGFIDFIEKRKETLNIIRKWEKELVKIETSECGVPVHVENLVDLEGPPPNFTYISKCQADTNLIFIEEDPPLWCECTDDCYSSKDKCCPANNDATFAYTKNSRLWLPPRRPIFECNKKCKCSKDCANRVIQKGRKHRLAIFRTDNECGWGVRALSTIPKGQFVTEYVGEIITVEEAERREKTYTIEGKNYLFDLDFNPEAEGAYVIDASHYGNIAHFINHSCDPNLAVYAAWIDNYNTNLPRIVFFSKRNIRPGEELTFDYHMTDVGPKQSIKQRLLDQLKHNKNLTAEEKQKFEYMLSINLVHASPSSSSTKNDSDDDAESVAASETNHDHSDNEEVPEEIVKAIMSNGDGELKIPTFSRHNFSGSSSRILCKCGASNCRFYLF
uniref:Histone-lysine N-methyltransferase n=3 Tax=Tetranychus urticae TaxID=32264 RepID=T1K3C0_TETUR